MMLRLMGAAGAVAAVLALEPASLGLTRPEARPAGASATGTSADPGTSGVAFAAPVAEVRAEAAPALSMVPKNRKVVDQLTRMLPANLSVTQAATGFRSQSQFIAAVQVSHNLKIPFDVLKRKVVTDEKTLGDAITELKPDASVTRELARARELPAQ